MTIRNGVYGIQDKLKIGSKQELVVWAVRNGLMDEAAAGVDSRQRRRANDPLQPLTGRVAGFG